MSNPSVYLCGSSICLRLHFYTLSFISPSLYLLCTDMSALPAHLIALYSHDPSLPLYTTSPPLYFLETPIVIYILSSPLCPSVCLSALSLFLHLSHESMCHLSPLFLYSFTSLMSLCAISHPSFFIHSPLSLCAISHPSFFIHSPLS